MTSRKSALWVPTAACALWLVVAATAVGEAAPVADQQQLIVDPSVSFAIGGASEQKLAQVVTTGMAGMLAAVRLPVGCGAGSVLVVEIQDTTDGRPNGAILTSETVPAASVPSPVGPFRTLALSRPVFMDVGRRFAIVLRSNGQCGTLPGPVGNLYPGGGALFDARPNPPGWVPLGERDDLAFETLIEPQPLRLTVLLTGCVSCRVGDRLVVQAHVINASAKTELVEPKLGVVDPAGRPINVLLLSGTRHPEVSLAPGLDLTVTLLDIVIGNGIPPGPWRFEAALLEPELGQTYVRAIAAFQIVP